MATSLQRVQDVFEAALARPAKERGPFLDEACGDDDELRAEVESLLEHDERASDEFLKPPEPGPDIRPPDGPDPLIGTSVGRYHVKGVIAFGGMATVYESVQQQPHRVVALKVMKRNLASRSALRRFQFESQVLARLRHPNVAQVYEAGMHTPEPRDSSRAVPYFAMEYIPGARSITEYATEKNLTVRERLTLFAKTCDAVHHGHQKGIIHRDLKPANILVDSHGEPKVIDFGVARATDSDLAITTQQTNIGQLVGTMQYMSPEQCDADPHDLDIRTDVYSLGVVLFELLTGKLPYEATGTTIYRATVVIREQAPRRLSAINPKLRGDVEAIALKALAKDREKRYQSAADLAADIRRHLNREPIEAKPATAWTRAVRWVGRHPVIATNTVSVGIAATIVGATFLSVWYVNFRPYEIRVSEDAHEARLLSFAGRPLYTWTAEPPGAITFAQLVQRPAELGGGKLALIGYTHSTGNPFRGSLCAFNADQQRETPIWVKPVGAGGELTELRTEHEYVAEQFGVNYAAVINIFEDRPGPEIVAIYRHAVYSPSAIRVYDLRGEVLYEIWHDGTVSDCYWMGDARLLVFVALSSEAAWDQRGHPGIAKVHPWVVFAIRPELGITGCGWVQSAPGDGPLAPAWYLCLLPAEAADWLDHLEITPPAPPYEPGAHVRVALTVDDQIGASVSWTANAAGAPVHGTRVVSDGYRQNQNLPLDDPRRLPLPNPELFKLGPLPPVIVAQEDVEHSAGE